jgi:preprotein translocase subunit YajC
VSDAEITVVWIVGIALMTWFVFIRPRRRMMMRQRELLGALSTGDQVVTVGGVYGSIVALDGDEVRLEIAPDIVIRVARRAVAGRVGPPSATAAEESEPAEELEEPDLKEPDSETRT